MKRREKAYDAEIAPRVAEIIKLCKKHDIGLFLLAQVESGGEHPLHVLTNIPAKRQSRTMRVVNAEARLRLGHEGDPT